MKQNFLSNEQLNRISVLKKYGELISELFRFLKMLFAFSTSKLRDRTNCHKPLETQ